MKKTNTSKSNPEKEHKTVKYIVEVDEPTDGQVASAGGVRENGKLVSQYKNPTLYKQQPQKLMQYKDCIRPYMQSIITESMPISTTVKNTNPTDTIKKEIKNKVNECAANVGNSIVDMIIYDYFQPFIKSKIGQVIDSIMAAPKKETSKPTCKDQNTNLKKIKASNVIEFPRNVG